MSRPSPRPRSAGFTLVELLVVIAIISLLTVATLPAVINGLNQRKVSEGARILQASLAGARDAAIRSNAPRGIRLLPDPSFRNADGIFASSRFISIEPAPDYTEGLVFIPVQPSPAPPVPLPMPFPAAYDPRLRVFEAKWADPPTNTIPNPPTSWYWNIRQGDRLRLGASGRSYTIAGPIATTVPNFPDYPVINGRRDSRPTNPERLVNLGPSQTVAPTDPSSYFEVLYLVNGEDDDGDGHVDESFDGIDQDDDGFADPGFDGLDNDGDGIVDNDEELFWSALNAPGVPSFAEWEPESFVARQFVTSPFDVQYSYSILRRPMPSPGARETRLPEGVVVDLTTWNARFAVTPAGAPAPLPKPTPERSQLPIDPQTLYVDILIAPNGQVLQSAAASGTAPAASFPFYHFWLADREDVELGLLWGSTPNGIPIVNPNHPVQTYLLPMPEGTFGYPPSGQPFLKGERRLVTLFTRNGQIVTTTIENSVDTSTSPPTPIRGFSGANTNLPYLPAQSGVKEEL